MDMKRIIEAFLLPVAVGVLSACTDFQGIHSSAPLSIDQREVVLSEKPSVFYLIVKSGSEWTISSMPAWVSVREIRNYGVSQFEWAVYFDAQENPGEDREGIIVFRTDQETINVTLRQSKPPVYIIPVESITIPSSEMTLEVGSSTRLTWFITPSDATNQNVIWRSNNAACVSVSDGVVTALAVGSAIITVQTEDGGKTASCSVTVVEKNVPVTGVSLDRSSMTLVQGESQPIFPTVSPDNASDKTVTWSSSNPSTATVDGNGVVTAVSIGTATITVTTRNGGFKATCTVTVVAATIPVTGVSLNMTSLSMTVGDTQTIKATVNPSNATDQTVTWSSNNTAVATVSSSGVVTAKSAGTATITVKTNDGGKTATCTVNVKNKDVSGAGNENTGEGEMF